MNIVIEDDDIPIKRSDSPAAVKVSGNVRIGLLLLLIWSISVYLCNVAIDVVLAILYYQTGDCVDSLFTFVLILFPTILTSLLSYAYHEKIIFNPNTPSKITEVTGLLKKPVKDDADTRKSSSKSFVFRLICNVFLLGPILWYCDSFWSSAKKRRIVRRTNSPEAEMINPPNVDDDRKAEERTNTNQLILAFVYSAPQLVFQLSRMVNNVEFFSIDSPITQMQVASTATSLLSLAWSVAITYPINQTTVISILLFLGQLLMIGGRVSIVIFFTLVYGWWSICILILLALIQNFVTAFCLSRIKWDRKDLFFFLILGYTQLFVFFPFNEHLFPRRQLLPLSGFFMLFNTFENAVLLYASFFHGYQYRGSEVGHLEKLSVYIFVIYTIGCFMLLCSLTADLAMERGKILVSLCQRTSLDELALKEFYSLVMDQLDLSDCTDGDNNSPLMLLCRHNTNSSQLFEVANVLLQTTGIDLNDRNSKEGFNALHILCAFNQGDDIISVVRLLISHKIRLNSKSRNGSTALSLLRRRDDLQSQSPGIIQLLLEFGAVD